MSDRVEDQIRLGLRLLAEDVQSPTKIRVSLRPPRLLAAAAGLAVLTAAAVVVVTDRRGTPPAPRFLADSFNYQPGAVVGAPEGPLLPYSFPTLSDVAAASARDAWIVGSDNPTYGSPRQEGVAWRWDGTAWQTVAMPTLPGNVDVHSVATVADGQAWAVGSHSVPRDYRVGYALVEHWISHRWQVVSIPLTGPSTLFSVSASGPRDVWAIGQSFLRGRQGKSESRTRPVLIHWDGSSWSRVALPWASQAPGFGANVVATGPTDVWVVSGGQIAHWDGGSWQAVPAPFGPRDPIRGFSATGADDAWAVGSFREGRHSRTLAAHWNGQSWEIAPTPNRGTDSDFSNVVAVTPDDAWAIGQSERLTFLANGGVRGELLGPLFEHWDGRSWHVTPRSTTPPISGGAEALAAAGDGTAWVVGNCGVDNVVARWSGSVWTITAHPPDQLPRRHRSRLRTCGS